MYKALITDIDGTVTAISANGSDITQETKDAVSRVYKAGKHIACATGRGWGNAGPVVKQLGFTDPCIIQAGSCIINPLTEHIMWEATLSAQESQQILNIFKRITLNTGLIKTSALPERTELASIAELSTPNRVIYLMKLDSEMALEVKEAINKTDFAVAHNTTPSWYGPEFTDVHVTNPEGTKEHAILEWQKIMNITKEETVGIGDGENDIPIFHSVGLKLAVGNAHPNLKAHADQVVSAYDEGGLQDAIDILMDNTLQ